MREDPIVYEDWQPSFANRSSYRSIQYVDGLISLVFMSLLLSAAINQSHSTYIILSLLIMLGYIGLEIISSQYGRSSLYRIFAVIGLYFAKVTIAIVPDFISPLIFDIILGVALLLKLAFIPILDVLNESYGEILIPRNTKVMNKLDFELRVLSVTDYAVDLKIQDEIRLELVRKILIQFIPISILSGILVFAFTNSSDENIRYFRLGYFLVVLFVSLLLQSVLFGPQLIRILREEGLISFIWRKIKFKVRRKKKTMDSPQNNSMIPDP